MSKKKLLLAGIALILLCFIIILTQGKSYTLSIPSERWGGTEASADDFLVETDRGLIELTGSKMENGSLELTLQSVQPGREYVTVYLEGEPVYLESFHIHTGGILTRGTYFGDCSGNWIIPIAVFVFLLLLLWYVLSIYIPDVRENLYRYKNVRNLALIIFLISLLLGQARFLFIRRGVDGTIQSIMGSASLFSWVVLPAAFVVFVLVTASNIRLMQKEGRSWRNMLGCMLGILLCLSTVLPSALGEFLQRATFVDVHNEKGAALYIELITENTVFFMVAYLECILIATIILSLRAARRVPAFDKDYILILGCQIKEDGSLTNLLKGRADRALEFARMQEESTGKRLKFVPSGGKGPDEVTSEAEAIRNYLISAGIPEDRILAEKQSANTFENIRNSMALIREDSSTEAKAAFSTTNYHVFRSGIFATDQGYYLEGIGSRTKAYFWINAFVREFIATLHSERKAHLKVILMLFAIVLFMVGIIYLSVVM